MSTAKVKAAAAAPSAASKAAPLAANDAAKQIEQAVAAGKETIETVVQASKDAAAKAQTAAFRSYEDAVGSTKDTVDAIVQAGTVLSQGLQEIGTVVFGLTQASFEDGVAASKQLLAAKTIRDVIDVQNALAKQYFDRAMGESTRLSDLSVKLVEQTFAPLTQRVNATVDRLVKGVA